MLSLLSHAHQVPGPPVAGDAPPWAHLVHGHVAPHTWTGGLLSGLHAEPHPLALFLALLEPQLLHLFQDWLRGRGGWNLRNVTPRELIFHIPSSCTNLRKFTF